MTIKEFRLNCLEYILNAVDDVEYALSEHDDDDKIPLDDVIQLKICTQGVVNALDWLKAWIDDLDWEE